MNPRGDEIDWNERFAIQAGWTKQLRLFLYQQISLQNKSNVLEVGCGTGVILRELEELYQCAPLGIDIDFHRLKLSKLIKTNSRHICSDLYMLPFSEESFDFVVCHYLFLWLTKPIEALIEIKRILKPGGIAIALAEPDYSGRIESPGLFEQLALAQMESLVKQGVDPKSGRNLAGFFSLAGFTDIQFGLSGFQSSPTKVPESFASEWEILVSDLMGFMTMEEIDSFRRSDLQARGDGSRVSWVPTFYAFGKKTNLCNN
jgi:ubiquinone/menaquinone biosynthesis C-methylase UbiE